MKLAIPAFENARVLVVGDVMLDCYWHGDTDRISPEAPVPVVHVRRVEERPGGAGNVALNVRALGSQVCLLGLTGDDAAAVSVEGKLMAAGVECHLFRVPGTPTINKLRVIGRNQQLIRLDLEEQFGDYAVDDLLAVYTEKLAEVDVVILSDYSKGVLKSSAKFIALAKAKNIPVLVDPKSKDFEIYRGATVITPNLTEFEAVVGACFDLSDIEEKAGHLLKKFEFTAVLVTRGAQGMSMITADGKVLHLPAQAKEVYDVTGAGDTVIATFGSALAAGAEVDAAATLANVAAGVAVSKLGTVAVSAMDLRGAMQAQLLPSADGGVLTLEDLLLQIDSARARGERVVMTNGCFDILHAGHVRYLEQAKALGQRLVIAVNDDASVKRLKGSSRPVNGSRQRMLLLAALRAVDWVVEFSEDTPARVIKAIKPDVLVKGGDYALDQIVGADFVVSCGGEVVVIPFEDGFSTSATITKIKES